MPIASRLADDDEFRTLAAVLGDYDHGVFMATFGEKHGIPFLEELTELSGRPGCYAPHFYFSHQPERAHTIMQQAEAARARGRGEREREEEGNSHEEWSGTKQQHRRPYFFYLDQLF